MQAKKRKETETEASVSSRTLQCFSRNVHNPIDTQSNLASFMMSFLSWTSVLYEV